MIPQTPVSSRLLVILSLLAATAMSSLTYAQDKRPNILFALADDWGWPHAGAYGDHVVKTPAFDRIAREGLLFQQAYISSPSCTPSRNAILTGQQFYRLHQGANLWSTLDASVPNFMYLLKDDGYEIGHWRKAWGPGDYKVGGYEEHPCGPDSTFEEFMANRKEGTPFCFWFGTTDPHRDYEKGSGAESGIPVDEVHVPDFYPDTELIRSDIADYYFEVQRWDSQVGEAIRLLEEAGELDNTIIVMSGDHGMPFPRCKGNVYDWGARVPLAIRWGAEIEGGRSVSDFVSLTDLAPTFLKATGTAIPEAMTGKQLQPYFGNSEIEQDRDFVVFGRERHTPAQEMPSMDGYPMRAIRTDNWLLVLNLNSERWPAGVPAGSTHPISSFADCDGGPSKEFIMSLKDDPKLSRYYELSFGQRPEIELYDCREDPDQIENLAANPMYSDTVDKLKERLVTYLTDTEDPRFTGSSAEFDHYPYQGKYLKPYLEKHGFGGE